DRINLSESGCCRNEALERHSEALHIGRCGGVPRGHERDVSNIRLVPGVAHVPAALRDTLRGGKTAAASFTRPRDSLSAESQSVFGYAHGPRSRIGLDRSDA